MVVSALARGVGWMVESAHAREAVKSPKATTTTDASTGPSSGTSGWTYCSLLPSPAPVIITSDSLHSGSIIT